jgi:DNA-binding CsgD family transcriptional regulator
VVLELGLALARAGAPDAVEPLTEIVERDRDSAAITTAALELSGMLFYAGRPAEAVVLARRAQARLRPASAEHERLEVALLGWSYTSASARQAAEETIAGLRDPGGPAQTVLQATVLATLAMDEVAHLGSAPRAIDLARRALAVPLPVEPHRGESWAMLALATLVAADELDAARRGTDEVLTQARQRGAALTVATISALRAVIGLRSGELSDAQADAETAIDLASELLGKEFLVLAVTAAVFAGLERGESTDSLRRLIQRSGVAFDPDFLPGAQLLHATAALRAAAGNHEAAVDALRSCAGRDPTFGGENPAMVAWRSSAALSLSELGRYEEARNLAADEVRRAREFGAPRALGIALRTEALVGSPADRPERLAAAHEALAESPARLEQARVLTDLGATLRAGGQRSAAREPLLEALALASRCGAQMLELRARSELAAIGLRPRRAARTGTDGLTPSERRVVELAATGGTNREIAQTLFVTEKTVETHLGRAFRKLDVSSRRQLADVLASASG